MSPFQNQLGRAAEHLAAHDSQLALLITRHGMCTIVPHTQYYRELVSSIIGQQLSVKAADTIWRRFLALWGNEMPSPEQIVMADTELIRGVGVSYAKIRYIKDLAAHILDGSLDLDHLASLDNVVIIEQLTAVKGIGEWSAHMFLIFSLGRLDVLPWGDLGVRKSAQIVYSLPELPNKAELIAVAATNNWHPYESVAAWYLWQNLDNAPIMER